MIPCELDLTSTPCSDTTIITYEIEFPTSGNKFGFNLLDDKDSTISYIIDTIPKFPDGRQLPTQAKRNVWIISINVEEPITYQGAFGEIKRHQNPRGNSKFNISLCKRKPYNITDLEEIPSRFDQVRPVVSNIEFCLPNKHPTPNNISECLKGPQR